MIVLFTDFGLEGPYTGQVKARLAADAPGVPVIDLFADAPAGDPHRASYLLAAYAKDFPPESVHFCVVDPGVGGPRAPLAARVDGHWYVGPDNGLFEMVLRRAAAPPRVWEITWRPERLSPSFHGRDLFAPVAARLATGAPPDGTERPEEAIRRPQWPDDLAEVVYVDRFGNAMTGLRGGVLVPDVVLSTGNTYVKRAEIFSQVPPGLAFWYENANGLAEIAVNQGRANEILSLRVGSQIGIGGRFDTGN